MGRLFGILPVSPVEETLRRRNELSFGSFFSYRGTGKRDGFSVNGDLGGIV